MQSPLELRYFQSCDLLAGKGVHRLFEYTSTVILARKALHYLSEDSKIIFGCCTLPVEERNFFCSDNGDYKRQSRVTVPLSLMENMELSIQFHQRFRCGRYDRNFPYLLLILLFNKSLSHRKFEVPSLGSTGVFLRLKEKMSCVLL